MFDCNKSRRPILRTVVDFHLLLCTEFNLEHWFLCLILLRDQWRSKDWAEQWVLLWSVTRSCEIHWLENSNLKKTISSLPKIYKALNLLTFKLSQYCKSGTVGSTNCNKLGNTLWVCVCAPVTCQAADLLSKPKLSSGTAFGGNCQMTSRGAQTWTQTWILPPYSGF